jgi:alpha-beta hydrolase superfamily lysophospholipase
MRGRLLALVLALALAGCAPLRQGPATPAPGFSGPRLEDLAFVSFDGARLGLRHWDAPGEPWAVIVALHGMDDHAETFHLAAPWWASQGITTYAYDQRGYGRSPERGIWPRREVIDRDLQTMVALVRQRYPHALVAVVGVSMGGAAAVDAFARPDAPQADRVILMSPAVWGWSDMPLYYRVAVWLAAHTIRGLVLQPPGFITSKVAASDNLPELIRMGRDPLMIWGARPDTLLGLVELMTRAWTETGQIGPPTLYGYGAHDQIIPPRPAFQAAARLKPGDRTAYYPKGCHLLLNDLEGPVVWRDVESFIRDPAAPLPSGAAPIPPPAAAPHEAERCIPRRPAPPAAPQSPVPSTSVAPLGRMRLGARSRGRVDSTNERGSN